MPKVNPLRSLANERNVATRIRFEREKRGWTYDGLASRMTRDGNPMQASAIYKIEKGEPPRRITVDELVGFAVVFELDPSTMLMPMEDVLTGEARKITQKLQGDLRQLFGVIDSMVQAHIAMFRLQSSSSETDQAVLERIVALMPSGSVAYPMGPYNNPTNPHVSPDPISDAFGALAEAFMTYASWYVNNERGST